MPNELETLVGGIASMTLEELLPLKRTLEEQLRVVNMLVANRNRKERSEKRRAPGRPKGSRNRPAPVENGEVASV